MKLNLIIYCTTLIRINNVQTKACLKLTLTLRHNSVITSMFVANQLVDTNQEFKKNRC